MTNIIDSVAALEAVVGRTPAAVNLKVIDHIDPIARRWLASSPLMFVGFGDGAGVSATLAGGVPGFANSDGTLLSVALDAIDDPGAATAGASFGSLFLLPGVGETLRVNGRVADVRDGRVRVSVEQCYGHCAKALIRSDFWKAEPVATAPDDPGAFVAASRFFALATVDADGHADLSPKGDPAGTMAQYEANRLSFADRPGNRRTDSFRNILAQPRIAAVLLVPGSTRVALVRGVARLTTDAAARAHFVVRDKVPLLVTRVDELEIAMGASAALERARLWPAAAAPADIRPAQMFAEHVKLNRHRGLGARVAAAAVSVPGLLRKGLDRDYKDNLY